MSQPPAEIFPVAWQDLPDPRDPQAPAGKHTEVVLSAEAWEHIVRKHIANRREPWDELLSRPVRKRVVLEHGTAGDEGWQATQEAVDRLGRQIRHSLERPLVMLYRVGQPGARRQVWLLVLPSGATAYVHVGGMRPRLATCYFPAAAVVEIHRERRWERVVATLVGRYGVVSRRQLLPPSEEHTVRIPRQGSATETRGAIVFVTLANWGFAPELPGSPWRGRLSPWEAAGEPEERDPGGKLGGPGRKDGKPHRLWPRARRSVSADRQGEKDHVE